MWFAASGVVSALRPRRRVAGITPADERESGSNPELSPQRYAVTTTVISTELRLGKRRSVGTSIRGISIESDGEPEDLPGVPDAPRPVARRLEDWAQVEPAIVACPLPGVTWVRSISPAGR
ncbi:hypothetical protein GOTRE_175_01280 [Gordonia terrae NBRC 100016]|uniref:Uncharacterized protein n=1 Tax=Gordonia terrae NBRC 100016 TaxID=1089454 RepID=A0ABQ0HL91_9ACTN|nr:hypothetical protein GOTRE_175_01280 [Gordonia terrae NBRC 100016]